MNILTNVFTIDLEASGLEPECYPIEVAISNVLTQETHSWLIKPTNDWRNHGFWSAKAEALHHISLDDLDREGLDPATVAEALVQCLPAGACVLSDAPPWDAKWLSQLFSVAQRMPTFQVEHFERFRAYLAAKKKTHPLTALLEAQRRYPIEHRAAPDAQRNAEILRLLDA